MYVFLQLKWLKVMLVLAEGRLMRSPTRIHVDPSAVKWSVLPEMIRYGSDLQARVAEAMEELKSPHSQLATKGVKRKAGSSLRETDPW
jgi:hypothetical protein